MYHRHQDAQKALPNIRGIRVTRPVEVAKAFELLPDIDKFYSEIARRSSYLSSEETKRWLRVHHAALMPTEGPICRTCQCNWWGYPMKPHKTEDCGVPKQHVLFFLATNTASYCPGCLSTEDRHESCQETTPICEECKEDGVEPTRHYPETGICQLSPDFVRSTFNMLRIQYHMKIAADSQQDPFKIKLHHDKRMESFGESRDSLLGCPAYQSSHGRGLTIQYTDEAKEYEGLIPKQRVEQRAIMDQKIAIAIGRYALQDNDMSDDGWGSPADPQQRDERPAAPEEPPMEPKPKKVDTIDIDVRCFLNKIRIGRIRRQIVQDNTKQSVTIPSKDEIYDQFVNVASEKIYELMDIKPELRTRLEETAKEANSYYMSTKEQFEETYHTRPQLLQNNVQKIISAGDISVIDEILLIQKALTNTDEGRASFQSSLFLHAMKCGKVNWLHEYHELLTKLLMVCLLHDRSTVTRLQKEGSPIDTQSSVMMVPTLRNYLNCLKEKRQLVFDLYVIKTAERLFHH